MTNPLLDFSDHPRFDAIRPEHIGPAISLLLDDGRQTIARLEAATEAPSWEKFVEPLENVTERLGRAWGVVGHLNAVVNTPELRAAYNENQPLVVEFWTALGQNEALFAKYKQLQQSPAFASLTPARRRIVDNAVRDFKLGGADLSEKDKARFAEIQEQQATLSNRFSENVLDATNSWELLVDDATRLAGLPDDAREAARALAESEGKPGYKFTLHFPSYFPVLQYAEDRALREAVYRGNATKASELGEKPEWDNTAIIADMLRLRREEARLLGYDNFAEVSLVPKMAETPRQVIDFLEDLAKRARPFAENDIAELRSFAKTELGLERLEAWDITWASEKLREKRYAFSDQEVKQYFPESKVIAGLFGLVRKLFHVEIKDDKAPTWHEDVRFFRIERDGRLVGQFYLDLYARNGKRGGAWMDDARGRRVAGEMLQTPVAYLTCNFTPPAVADGRRAESLFTHDEVTTLFHEFGHGLHHMLTLVDELGVSGISGVEWDAVELPSQFMENFCWEWDVLQGMTAHTRTGEPLPRALYDKMIAAKNFQSGLQMLRQVEFSLFDMHLHYDFDPDSGRTAADVLAEVRHKFAVLVPPPFNRFQNSFSHIFSGGYAAGYYSYKWAEVLSADAYAAFEEAADDPHQLASTGLKFHTEILAVGGSRSAMDSFKAFRGREPTIDALLRHNGMTV
ncbi:MAG: family metallopeptidase [Paucimonas sp.]|nr:family metallopeptidase [Paucimonas sp.]